nr:MAG TPA: hypothetical protein [Caudoviricetes sp.]
MWCKLLLLRENFCRNASMNRRFLHRDFSGIHKKFTCVTTHYKCFAQFRQDLRRSFLPPGPQHRQKGQK